MCPHSARTRRPVAVWFASAQSVDVPAANARTERERESPPSAHPQTFSLSAILVRPAIRTSPGLCAHGVRPPAIRGRHGLRHIQFWAHSSVFMCVILAQAPCADMFGPQSMGVGVAHPLPHALVASVGCVRGGGSRECEVGAPAISPATHIVHCTVARSTLCVSCAVAANARRCMAANRRVSNS